MATPPTVAEVLSERRREELREAVERLNTVIDRLEYLIDCEEDELKGGPDGA